jgi:hypothetical protein
LAFVFANRYFSHPVQTIFDALVSTPMAQHKGGGGPWAAKAGDGVLDFDRHATLATGRAFQAANLCQTRPIEMLGQSRAGL